MPTSGHFIFIPGVLLIGMVLGFILGMRAAADRVALEARRDEERQAAREERAQRKAAKTAKTDATAKAE